jgi:hypothetical protein
MPVRSDPIAIEGGDMSPDQQHNISTAHHLELDRIMQLSFNPLSASMLTDQGNLRGGGGGELLLMMMMMMMRMMRMMMIL